MKTLLGKEFNLLFALCILLCQNALVSTQKGKPNSASPQLKKTVVCEHRTARLECPNGDELKIVNANYGRTSKNICSEGRKSQKWNSNCKSDANSLKVAKQKCDGRCRCAIDATNSIFGDPCVGTEKYLQIEYGCYAPPETKTAMVCEGETLKLECPSGQIIDTVSANYGRTDGAVCGKKRSDLKCTQKNSLNIVKDRCNAKQKCTVEATNKVFGDPCVNTNKYLEVSYKCLEQSTTPPGGGNGKPKIYKALSCEGQTLDISCEKDDKILVQFARYGRSDRQQCPAGKGKTDNLQCAAKNSVEIVSERCDFKKSCSVPAENNLFGEPCSGVSKYLEVLYTCEAFPGRQLAVACEGRPLQLECKGKNVVLRILKANYGRTDKKTCPSEGKVSNANCLTKTSLNLLQTKCDRQQKCTVKAENSVFGDPCGGTFKYLEVQYECIDLSSLIDIRFGEDKTDANGIPL